MTPDFKVCSCGARFDEAQWEQLPLVGRQEDDFAHLEYRNCTRCGSTITIDLPPTKLTPRILREVAAVFMTDGAHIPQTVRPQHDVGLPDDSGELFDIADQLEARATALESAPLFAALEEQCCA